MEIRVNSPPTAGDDVLVVDPKTGTGKVNVLANDDDREDTNFTQDRVKITTLPRFGVATLKDGVVSVAFPAGKPRGFAFVGYTVTDEAGLTASARVHVRFPCNAVTGTDSAETLITGSIEDVAACRFRGGAFGGTFTLTGGKGADVFTIVRRFGGSDVITDFTLTGKDTERDLLSLEGQPSTNHTIAIAPPFLSKWRKI